MIIIGLTGSIGMGKSTTAAMLRSLRIPVHESDVAVHKLLAGSALPAIRKAFPPSKFPQIYTAKRGIDRKKLGAVIFADAKNRKKLESIMHPLVQKSQKGFLKKNKNAGFVVLDIPLLFETNAQKRVDCTIVVTAPAKIQRARVMTRPHMNLQKFRAILKRQMPDAQKRKRADYVLHTGKGRAQTLKDLKKILRDIRENNT